MHTPRKKLHKSTHAPWRFLHGGSHQAPKGRDFPLHSHSCWEWVYYRSGNIECLHGTMILPMHPGTLWITPPGVPHAEIAKTSYSNLYFEVEGPSGVTMPTTVQDDPAGTIGNLLRLILQELRDHRPYHRKVVDLLAETLALLIDESRQVPSATSSQQLVSNAETCWEDHPVLSVEEMAKRFGVSGSGFRQAFQRERGCSPVDRRMQLRTARAVRMLQSSTLKLEAVAGVCGFHSASHLSRCIKSAEGCSPGEMRDKRNVE